MANSIMVIRPYWSRELDHWVFDDPTTGLKAEAFVSGIPEILEKLLTKLNILKEARKGFILTFSAGPFPGYHLSGKWLCPGQDPNTKEEWGNWYEFDKMEGWLCPALFHYFEEAPENIYVKAALPSKEE